MKGKSLFLYNIDQLQWEKCHVSNLPDIKSEIRLMMKSVQVSQDEVYMVGGTNSKVTETYATCLTYSLSKQTLRRMPSMNEQRMSFGFLLFQDHVYVVGGAGNKRTLLTTCERICVSNPIGWQRLPCLN